MSELMDGYRASGGLPVVTGLVDAFSYLRTEAAAQHASRMDEEACHQSHVAGVEAPGTDEGTIVSEVMVVIGAGSIGQAIARRVSAGKHVLLADIRLENGRCRGGGAQRRRL